MQDSSFRRSNQCHAGRRILVATLLACVPGLLVGCSSEHPIEWMGADLVDSLVVFDRPVGQGVGAGDLAGEPGQHIVSNSETLAALWRQMFPDDTIPLPDFSASFTEHDVLFIEFGEFSKPPIRVGADSLRIKGSLAQLFCSVTRENDTCPVPPGSNTRPWAAYEIPKNIQIVRAVLAERLTPCAGKRLTIRGLAYDFRDNPLLLHSGVGQIDSQDSLSSFWSAVFTGVPYAPSLPSIDFSRRTVLVVSSGFSLCLSGVRIDSLVAYPSITRIYTTTVQQGSRCHCYSRVGAYWWVLEVERFDQPLEQVERHEYKDCH